MPHSRSIFDLIPGPPRRFAAILLLWSIAACRPVDHDGPFVLEWSVDPAFSDVQFPGIRIETGIHSTAPVRAHLVRVNLGAPGVRVSAHYGPEADRLQTATEMARSTGACVLINGGYYRFDHRDRARHVGLLVIEGQVEEAPVNGILWQRVRYPVARGTIGARTGGLPEIVWVGGSASRIVKWTSPFSNVLGRPDLPPGDTAGEEWAPEWALSAGPVVVAGGETRTFREEEAFFDTNIPRFHPRSAVGLTEDGHLLLVVVDGRQPSSRGVGLEELGVILRDLGATSAMNLDGGGSSTLVVDGRVVNRPSGTDVERDIVSALTVSCLHDD